jgi:uncharacterized membrane protein YphA (DoxX/SURF4 family)
MPTSKMPDSTDRIGAQSSKGRRWTGRVLSAVAILFLAMDAMFKFIRPAPVVQSFERLGYPLTTAIALGTLLLTCTILYAIPRTTTLGAALLTGYLGGAVSAHLRVGDPLFSHVLFPVYLGAMLWGGLYLRDARFRAMLRSY